MKAYFYKIYTLLAVFCSFLWTEQSSAAAAAAAAAKSVIGAEDAVWIHYTKVCPRGSTLVPGSIPLSSLPEPHTEDMIATMVDATQKAPRFRFTVHGVLNGPVMAHEVFSTGGASASVNRDTYWYAVLIPYSNIRHIVLGGYYQDVYLLGEVPLGNATILTAHDHTIPSDVPCPVVKLDSGISLSQGIERHLKSLGKPVLTPLSEPLQTIDISTKEDAKKRLASLNDSDVKILYKGALTKQQVMTGIDRLAENMLSVKKTWRRLPSEELGCLNNHPAPQAISSLLRVGDFPELNGVIYMESPFGDFEAGMARQNTFLNLIRRHLLEGHGDTEWIRQVTSPALQAEGTLVRQKLKGLKDLVESKMPEDVQKRFLGWRRQLLIWVKNLMDAEVTLRTEGKSLAIPHAEVDTLDQRLKRIHTLILSDRAQSNK